MNLILVWTCHASVFLYTVSVKCTEDHNTHQNEHNFNGYHEKEIHQEENIKKENRNKIVKEQIARKLNELKDGLSHSKEHGRQHKPYESVSESSHTHTHEFDRHVHDKGHREERERKILLSLERKEKEHKHKGRVTTVHPLFRFHTKSKTTEYCDDILTGSSGLLHELEQKAKQFTGDSEHYQRLYEEEYGNMTYPADESISEDYKSWEKWYNDYQKRPQNETTPHYAWWTYDPNETCEFGPGGVPLNYDRALYSLKMSSILPANVSAEVDAMYNQKSEMSIEYANRARHSMDEWARKEDFTDYNNDAGPIPERRELRDPWEIAHNRFQDKEYEWGVKLENDVKKFVVTPALKGLYHFKRWINPKYSTTTRRIAMTWPSHSLEDQEMLDMYKKYLREEKGLNISDEAGLSVFEKHRFTADSNYYDEDTSDMPHKPLNPY